MLFKYRFRPAVKTGSITLTYRTWSRPQVTAGKSYRYDEETALVVDAVDLVPVSSIAARDVSRTGYDSLDELIEALRTSSKGPLAARTRVYRIEFHVEHAAQPRDVLAASADLSASDVRDISERLARLDARSTHGPWTRETLELISGNEAVLAAELARRVGRDRLAFKTDVRKLKALGLTISLERGYRLSPRGRAYLRATT